MKPILNKITEIIIKTEEKIVVEGGPIEIVPVFATFGDLLLLTINIAPEQGFSITDIRLRLKIANAIEQSNNNDNKIFIDNTELPILKSSFDAFKWRVIHKDIVELSDILNSL